MSQDRWADVERYLDELFLAPDPALEAAQAANEAAGLPPIGVPPSHGKLLMLLAKIQGARSILEIGTLGGYSTIWLARALPHDGRLVTLEAVPEHADIARANIARADLGASIEIRVGSALNTLPEIAAEASGPFDLIFIDADKENNAEYVDWALKLSRVGTIIVVDNIVRNGSVVDPADTSAMLEGVRRGNARLAADPRVDATALQTVGLKGYDGFALALVTGPAP